MEQRRRPCTRTSDGGYRRTKAKSKEGTSIDANLDSQFAEQKWYFIPPTPGAPGSGTFPNISPQAISSLPTGRTFRPFLNPRSLFVDEIPSLYPLPLTSNVIPTGSAGASRNTDTATTGRRRKPNGSSTH
ncbi:hypothetical protein GYMLUDRAFT_252408 [Collybiopsis luxurians FD-317 M1]|uniref:Uncharacterized protein n=1 Tax=Collybiopsis luxurians FD-317 M1 TaxID=944289 RepID=A0A0D0C8J2_9AGAR|nr:hypothetical protein GYMLUDRAFT_252408 [Collybiopsis luxurians FD-317 M1]